MRETRNKLNNVTRRFLNIIFNKRILAGFLAVLTIGTSYPITAFAADNDYTPAAIEDLIYDDTSTNTSNDTVDKTIDDTGQPNTATDPPIDVSQYEYTLDIPDEELNVSLNETFSFMADVTVVKEPEDAVEYKITAKSDSEKSDINVVNNMVNCQFSEEGTFTITVNVEVGDNILTTKSFTVRV